jgi:hypothetical protein
MGEAIGIDIRAGKKYDLGGISRNIREPFYFHPVKLNIAGSYIETMAGFSYEMPMAGLLGHYGFFENFIVTFNSTSHPPTFEVDRITQH